MSPIEGLVDAKYEQALLEGLAHDLALPFLQIRSRQAALGAELSDSQIALSTDYGLRLLDSYSLALELRRNPRQLALEPCGLAPALQDAAHALSSYASHYEAEVEVDTTSSLRPVLVHRRGLLAALYCLGTSLIRAQAAYELEGRRPRIVLGAHRLDGQRVAAGIFGAVAGIGDTALQTARRLQGRARQPLAAAPAQSASGILLADLLMNSMHGALRAASHDHLPGLAAHLDSSRQLRLL